MPLSVQSRQRAQAFVDREAGNLQALEQMIASVRARQPGAADKVAKHVGISTLQAMELATAGIEAVATDRGVQDHLATTRRRSFVADEGGPGVGATLRHKGVHTLPGEAAPGESRRNDIGKLLSLGAIALPQLSSHILNRGSFELEAPLRPGSWRIPLDDKHHLDFKIEPGTTLKLKMDFLPGAKGPEISSARVELSRRLKLNNPAELAGFSGLVGGVADALVNVTLKGMEIDRQGSVRLDGEVERPSMNPLKHLLASGRSVNRLDSWLAQSFMPKVNTDATKLLRGQFLDKAGGGDLVSGGVPDRMDMPALLDGLGAVVDQGSFDLRLEGRTGFIEVGQGEITLKGKSSPLRARLSGDFTIDQREVSARLHAELDSGAIDSNFDIEGKARPADGGVEGELRVAGKLTPDVNQTIAGDGTLPVGISLGEQAVGARVGEVSVDHDDERVHLVAGKTVVDVIRDLEDQTSVRVGDHVHLDLDGEVLTSADASFRWDQTGVQVQAGDVNVNVEIGPRTQLRSDKLGLRLGPDSRLTMHASDVSIRDGALVIGSSETGFEARIDAGHVKRGPLTAVIDEGKVSTVSGTIELEARGGSPTARSEVQVDVSARPKALGFRLPVGAKIRGGARVEINGRQVTIDRHVDDVSPFAG
ncbi:MAG: hypothetical protein JRI68_33535 [Deltaproteobacteria bacterium]|nr:hypothetical protein [Deltaproteobacteria bacterium]